LEPSTETLIGCTLLIYISPMGKIIKASAKVIELSGKK
jgi:hypothetical protein